MDRYCLLPPVPPAWCRATDRRSLRVGPPRPDHKLDPAGTLDTLSTRRATVYVDTMPVSEAFNFRRATPLITTSGILSQAQLLDLHREHYNAVINLLPDDHEQAVAQEAD